MKTRIFARAITRAGVFFLAIVSCSTAPAGTLTSINPFTGTSTESFESFPVQVELPNPTPVFGGQATMTIGPPDVGSIVIYGPDNPIGNFSPSDGTQFAVTQDFGDSVSITFDSPSYQFGGYFGELGNDGFPPATIAFLDSNGATVASGEFSPGALRVDLDRISDELSIQHRRYRAGPVRIVRYGRSSSIQRAGAEHSNTSHPGFVGRTFAS